MPNSRHRKKSMEKSVIARSRNRAGRSRVATQIKKVLVAIKAKDSTLAQAELKKTIRILDKARSDGFYHANTIARKKSALTQQVSALTAAQ